MSNVIISYIKLWFTYIGHNKDGREYLWMISQFYLLTSFYKVLFCVFFSGNTEIYFVNHFDENFLAYYIRSIRSKGIIQSTVLCLQKELLRYQMGYPSSSERWCLKKLYKSYQKTWCPCYILSGFYSTTLIQSEVYPPNVTVAKHVRVYDFSNWLSGLIIWMFSIGKT